MTMFGTIPYILYRLYLMFYGYEMNKKSSHFFDLVV